MNSYRGLFVLGGLFVVLSYIVTLFTELCRYLSVGIFSRSFDLVAMGLDAVNTLFGWIFLILLAVYLFGKKITFLQKIIEKFPKISVYLFHLGWVNFILFIINGVIFALDMYLSFDENMAKYLVIMNIAGILTALCLASIEVLGRCKKAN